MSSALRTGAIALTVLLRAVCVTSIPLTSCGAPGAQPVLNASGYCTKGGAAVEALPLDASGGGELRRCRSMRLSCGAVIPGMSLG